MSYHQIADILLELEQELRRLDLWEPQPPAPEKLRSDQPFAIDTLTFPQWLQFIFIARMGVIVQQGLEVPSVSGIQPMAEQYFKDSDKSGARVTAILGQFDHLVLGRHSADAYS
jgi:uncharacterized protein YqcC (DUF446 family)